MQSCRAHELFIFSLQTYMTCKTKHVSMQKQDSEDRSVTSGKFDLPMPRKTNIKRKKILYLTCRQVHLYAAAASRFEDAVRLHRSRSFVQKINRRLIYGRSTRRKLRRMRHTGEEILRYSVYLLYYYFFLSYSITSLFL